MSVVYDPAQLRYNASVLYEVNYALSPAIDIVRPNTPTEDFGHSAADNMYLSARNMLIDAVHDVHLAYWSAALEGEETAQAYIDYDLNAARQLEGHRAVEGPV